VITRMRATRFTAVTRRCAQSAVSVVASIFSSTSTAPAASASYVWNSSPRSIDDETMRMGVGQCAMRYSVAASPLSAGIIMSIVMTSGRSSRQRAIAS
jgi:hypothetical protein